MRLQDVKNHWLYKLIPHPQSEASGWRVWTWALFGNFDDGIFGEKPSAGARWSGKWGDEWLTGSDGEPYWDVKNVGIKRFLLWQLRNPFHSLMFYVLGTVGREEHIYKDLLRLGEPDHSNRVLPFKANGLYIGTTDGRPFFAFRAFGWEGYVGCRYNGAWGAAFRRAR